MPLDTPRWPANKPILYRFSLKLVATPESTSRTTRRGGNSCSKIIAWDQKGEFGLVWLLCKIEPLGTQ
jgi:hypothetical protein